MRRFSSELGRSKVLMSRTFFKSTLIACTALLAACDGPHEQAGEKADAAAGAQQGPFDSGPSESIGEAQDRVEEDQARAVDARADAAEAKADQARETAEQKADALEKQADAIRDAGKQSAETLDKQAEAIRGKK
ncbi:putative membrane protein YqiK [Novosphingobium chloroacetimidivorans]|uniref:Putative membrane protein YqiK n=1 Tax=Novosphingobium chloroacetimidivorans TaxID=1428314 RepID=A0A7W7K8Q4_9SPHN|nr:hypothetical protein [Novosphingobium chloroacetimidivorans]MBB4858310.1 putative membrane protein YqiK [Novosphingobium chloroacetimidivorans]